jgi:hypothetical protein
MAKSWKIQIVTLHIRGYELRDTLIKNRKSKSSELD